MNIDKTVLKSLIEGDATALDSYNSGNMVLCAARCVEIAPPYVVQGELTTERGVMAAFSNPVEGETFLQILETVGEVNPVVKRALKWLEPTNGGIDFGDPAVRLLLDSLLLSDPAIPNLTVGMVNKVKAIAERKYTIHHLEVAEAMNVSS